MIKTFYKPTSLEEARLLKEKHGNLVAWFAGGTHINHFEFKANFEQVISLEGLGLHSIHSKTKQTAIGAMVTLQKLADSSTVPKALRQATKLTAPRTLRNMATLGGDIATGGKNTRLAPCLIALGAKVSLADGVFIPLEDYLDQGNKELILELVIPAETPICMFGIASAKSNGPILVNAAVSLETTSENTIEKAIVAVGGVEESVKRLTDVEKGLSDGSLIDRESMEKAVSAAINPETDLLGSSDYKKYITGITVADLIQSCLNRG